MAAKKNPLVELDRKNVKVRKTAMSILRLIRAKAKIGNAKLIQADGSGKKEQGRTPISKYRDDSSNDGKNGSCIGETTPPNKITK